MIFSMAGNTLRPFFVEHSDRAQRSRYVILAAASFLLGSILTLATISTGDGCSHEASGEGIE